MDINNNQQVNTFQEGMNTDTSDMMMKNSQYRFAKNLRLITDSSSNSGELRLIEGMSTFIDNVAENGHKAIATTSIRDIGIVIEGVEVEDGWTSWNIWRIDGNLKTKIFGECSDQIGKSLSLVTRYEDDDNIKLYIADGKNPLMYINVALIPNKSNIPHLMLNISSLSEHTFGGFSDFELVSGSLKPALVQYAYILYDKYGKSSSLSPLSKPYTITKNDSGYSSGETSSVGFKFTINENKNNSGYSKIKVYRITYQQVGQDASVDLIIDTNLDVDDYFNVLDFGIPAISSVSVSEFLSLIKITLIPKEIESKNNYLFASNVSYQIKENEIATKWFYKTDFSAMPKDGEELLIASSYNPDKWGKDGDILASGNSKNGVLSWKLKHWFGFDDDVDGIEKFLRENPSRKSLRRGEVYRYGIVLYDKYGNAWPVKWVLDLKTPDNKNTPYVKRDIERDELFVLFTIQSNADVPDFFRSFEIVRCNRGVEDRINITQGIIGRVLLCHRYAEDAEDTKPTDFTQEEKGHLTGYLCPSGFLTPSHMLVYNLQHYKNEVGKLSYTYRAGDLSLYTRYADSSDDIILFASPEYSYQSDDVYNIIHNANVQVSQEMLFKIDVVPYDQFNASDKIGTSTALKIRRILYSQNDETYGFGYILWLVNKYGNGEFTIRTDAYSLLQGKNDGIYIPVWLTTYLQPYSENYSEDSKKELIDNTRNTIFNYIKPISILDKNGGFQDISARRNWDIKEVNEVKVPEWNLFANNTTATYTNAVTAIDGKTFIGWSVPVTADFQNKAWILLRYNDEGVGLRTVWDFSGMYENFFAYPVGSVGKSMLLKINSTGNFDDNHFADGNEMNILVCNIRRVGKQPYGGYTEYARTNSKYYSHGYYGKFGEDNEIFTYGDCYIQDFYYNALKTWYSSEFKYAPNMSTVYVVPVETDIDMSHDFGQSYKRNSSKYIQDDPAELRGYTQSKSAYLYNTAYGIDPNVRAFTGIDSDDASNIDYDYRIHYSNPKENNESIDSWLNFKPANFIDVDTRYGQITDLRLFKDTLVFWLENATGVLSVNERTIIQDANDTNIILGNGDVLQRYDYLTTEYGMKPDQYADGQSNTTLYWWDGNKKEILGYSGGQAIMPMKKAKTVSNHINSGTESDHPVLAYDVKYDEMLMNVVNNHPLAYSEIAQQFISEYEVGFKHKIYLKDKLLLVNENDTEEQGYPKSVVYKWNENSNLKPYVKYVVNNNSTYNKVFDITTFGGRFYGGELDSPEFAKLKFVFKTPLKQESRITDPTKEITNREYDYRLTIPRAGKEVEKDGEDVWVTEDWGDRMRGKTMECEFSSTSPDKDFSLQYIITKFRMSWA